MASSSVSQESLDYDDFDIAARRSRIRALRARTTSMQYRNESTESAELGPVEGLEGETTLGIAPLPNLDHESPTRMANRMKDKRGRPNHLYKGKTAKDKRKLREKRRSTGVVHLASTESTGDSLDEEDTRRNTNYNEVIDADNPQTPEEDRRTYVPRSRNKSPSDLEADLEDNQDYDSTVSQSETNLTLIGQAPPMAMPPAAPTRARMYTPQQQQHQQQPDSSSSQLSNSSSQKEVDFCRPVSYPSRYKDQDFDLERLGTRESGLIRASFSTTQKGVESNGEASHRAHKEKERPAHGHLHHTPAAIAMTDANLAVRNRELERLLEAERKENGQLREFLQLKDNQITQLEREISLLNKELDVADEENEKLQQENKALLRAVSNMNLH